MMDEPEVLNGVLLEEETAFTLADLSHACCVDAEWIVLLVEEGVLEPVTGTDIVHWRFSGASLHRARTALRLQRDLGLNIAGIALALDLLDEIESLQRSLAIHSND